MHPVVKRWIDSRWNRDLFDLEPILPDGPDKISGTVQVLEEAREVTLKQQETKMIEEELMARAVSPKRVEKWVNEGFEMFP
jgi:hypothetical protein